MRIITLIATYQDDPRELGRLVHQAPGPVAIVADNLDASQALYAATTGATLRLGHFLNERSKRQALLDHARAEYLPTRDDWLLSLDPDEKLLNGDVLPMLLERVPPDEPFFPLLRTEPNGHVWVMPSKLIRGSAQRYSYLDVGIDFGPEWGHWNLDPSEIVEAFGVYALPGWPHVQHYRSPRADSIVQDSFYSEPDPAPDFDHSFLEWRTRHDQHRYGFRSPGQPG